MSGHMAVEIADLITWMRELQRLQDVVEKVDGRMEQMEHRLEQLCERIEKTTASSILKYAENKIDLLETDYFSGYLHERESYDMSIDCTSLDSFTGTCSIGTRLVEYVEGLGHKATFKSYNGCVTLNIVFVPRG